MPTDTTEKGLEDLIVAAMTEGAASGEPEPAEVRERPAAYAPGWILGDARNYNREYAVDLAQLGAFKETDPNKLHDLKAALDGAEVYTDADVDAVVESFLANAGRERLDPILDACVATVVPPLAARACGLATASAVAEPEWALLLLRDHGQLPGPEQLPPSGHTGMVQMVEP